MVAGFILLAVIVLGILNPALFQGYAIWIVSVFIAFSCGYILYDTSNVLHHYRTDQHAAAAMALFSSVAMLFWYVLQLVMLSRD